MGNVLFESFIWGSVNYICQVCKLYFYFGHVQNFGQYLYLSVLVNSVKSFLLLALVKYMLRSHFTQNCIFLRFLEAKNPCFVTKNCRKFSFICVFILLKKWYNWFHKKPQNSGMVGRRMLPNPSLLYDVRYTLSFQLTNFGLKWIL